ncbi:MAG: PD40 domain-containing protein [Bacteroidetes bacterium]|nr:PD40 domain-containing protein [Bacteroidota bacterium]
MKNFIKWVVPGIAVLCTALSAFSQTIVNPLATPKVFSQEGVDSTSNQSVAAFTPDEKTVYIADGQTIVVSKKVNGKWTKPVTAPFSGQWKDWDPTMSPDGKRLIFVSTRPLEGMPQDKAQKNAHLWYVDLLSGDSWSAPKHFDAPVNEEGFNDFGPSVSGIGSVCFCSRNRDGNKGMRGYYIKWLGDHYDTPKVLALNGDSEVYDPFIAPDEHYIIFVSNNELYISYRNGDGWSQGQKLPANVNNGKGNSDPYVSPDGKMLYYSQDKAPGILMVPVNIPKTHS